MFRSNFATPGVAMVMSVREESTCLLTFGISPSFGLVKTELNWCRSISAFCLLSFSKISFLEGVRCLHCLVVLLLPNIQNGLELFLLKPSSMVLFI